MPVASTLVRKSCEAARAAAAGDDALRGASARTRAAGSGKASHTACITKKKTTQGATAARAAHTLPAA